MAIFTGTYLPYDVIGMRESLSNAIYNISPADTPLVSGMPKETVDATRHDWQTDTLASVDTGNAALVGDDITSFPSITPTVRVGNNTQISRKLLIVAGTTEVVNKAGRKSEMAYNQAKKSVELKKDIEAIVFENIGGVTGDSTTAPLTATLGAWVKTNTDKGTGGGDPTYTSGVPAAARTDAVATNQRAFTETILKNVIQKCYTSGNVPKNLFAGPYNKTVVSGFQGVVTRNFNIATAKPTAVIAAVDVYVSDFGVLKVMPSRLQRERDAWLIDFKYIALGHLRPFKVIPLAKTGDAEKRMLLVEWLFKCRQEAALGLCADLATS
jgi:Family of unknown function (DUF5309)